MVVELIPDVGLPTVVEGQVGAAPPACDGVSDELDVVADRTDAARADRWRAEGRPVGTPVHLRGSLSSSLPLFRQLAEARAQLETSTSGRQRPSKAKITQPNRKLTPAEVDQLVTAYLGGADLKALGEQFGMHRQTVRAHLRRRDIELRSDSAALSEVQIDVAVRLYAEGLSTAKIGQRLGTNASTVQRGLKGRGVRLRAKTDHRTRPS
ncbi:hypothetical protein E4P41_08620 [Geodermatophilus sp. DF01-2]|uniref:hypothetical protein n=1 Tax=Geodermatophilus sp. DF01-2 TaxID=2559610 RepID=UPI001074712C|nr:hypothetical protein [Geodermatophilus sp. DF01_2]TFV62053.1 hypothetical protein E4P41_08620 [Geodermatophilus sp. DF01_2]